MRRRNGRPSASFIRSLIGRVWSCHGASPSSSSPADPLSRPAPSSADSGIGPSVDKSPAKKPFSHDRCTSENGALDGMISILGGGVIWFMTSPPLRPACAGFRHHGDEQRSGTFLQAKRDG